MISNVFIVSHRTLDEDVVLRTVGKDKLGRNKLEGKYKNVTAFVSTFYPEKKHEKVEMLFHVQCTNETVNTEGISGVFDAGTLSDAIRDYFNKLNS